MCSQVVVASGPFVLSKYVANQSITLTSAAATTGARRCGARRARTYLDKVVFKVVPEAGVRTGSLQSDQVNAIGSVGEADEAALKGAGVNLQTRANPGVVCSTSA